MKKIDVKYMINGKKCRNMLHPSGKVKFYPNYGKKLMHTAINIFNRMVDKGNEEQMFSTILKGDVKKCFQIF